MRSVATAIYYVESENITPSRLDFRAAVNENGFEFEQNCFDEAEAYYGIVNGEPFDDERCPEEGRHQSLGGCSTPARRTLAWPNTLQHRVAPFELSDPSAPGHRSILVFFLVDPFACVRSTATVPPQQREWLAMELRRMPRFAALPPDVLHLVLSFVPGLMTFEQAAKRRAALMHERKFFETIVNEEIYERPFSLCEH